MTIDLRSIGPKRDGTEPSTQYAAICWRVVKDGVQVLLITSRETGRWVLPKGWPINGMSPENSAAREAWEEAGVRGKVDPHCLGLYSYDKAIGPTRSPMPCVVAVYGLKVQELSSRFPERKERRRKWFSPQKAASKVDEPELQMLLSGITLADDRSLKTSPTPTQK